MAIQLGDRVTISGGAAGLVILIVVNTVTVLWDPLTLLGTSAVQDSTLSLEDVPMMSLKNIRIGTFR